MLFSFMIFSFLFFFFLYIKSCLYLYPKAQITTNVPGNKPIIQCTFHFILLSCDLLLFSPRLHLARKSLNWSP